MKFWTITSFSRLLNCCLNTSCSSHTEPKYRPVDIADIRVRMSSGLDKSFDGKSDVNDPEKSLDVPPYRQDAFGDEEFAEVKYKVLKWWYVLPVIYE